MKATTLRFDEKLWDLIEREAARGGVSAAQYVRDAVVMRVAGASAREGSAEVQAELAAIAEHGSTRKRDRAAEVLADPARLAALHESRVLESPPQASLDRLTRLAQRMLNVRTTMVSVLDERRHLVQSSSGDLQEPYAKRRELPMKYSLCSLAVGTGETLVIRDTQDDPSYAWHPAVEDLGVRAYLGIPLRMASGQVLGTLCALDDQPRMWMREEVLSLQELAESVVSEIELGRLGGETATG